MEEAGRQAARRAEEKFGLGKARLKPGALRAGAAAAAVPHHATFPQEKESKGAPWEEERASGAERSRQRTKASASGRRRSPSGTFRSGLRLQEEEEAAAGAPSQKRAARANECPERTEGVRRLSGKRVEGGTEQGVFGPLETSWRCPTAAPFPFSRSRGFSSTRLLHKELGIPALGIPPPLSNWGGGRWGGGEDAGHVFRDRVCLFVFVSIRVRRSHDSRSHKSRARCPGRMRKTGWVKRGWSWWLLSL